MKICAISDLHGNLVTNISQCDLILIGGDIFPLDIQSNMPECKEWISTVFSQWANNLPCRKVIFIAGNHDFWLERNNEETHKLFPTFNKVTYLKNELYNHEGVIIFGTPYCKIFGNWAFMRDNDTMLEKFKSIPDFCDIVLSHDAPYGVNDIVLEDTPWTDGNHIGNPALAVSLLGKKPKYNIHGHLHSTKHDWELLRETKVINVSILNEKYEVAFAPLYFNII